MRKLLNLAAFICLVVSCSNSEELTRNITEAANLEYNQSVLYGQYAIEAQQENHQRVAALFRAISESEKIHYDLLLDELKRLGVKKFKVQASNTMPSGDSTINNLYKAATSEQYDYYNLYPEFIEVAKDEKVGKAKRLLIKINAAEENLAVHLLNAIGVLEQNGSDSLLVERWMVCRECGQVVQGDSVELSQCDKCKNKTFIIHNIK